MAGRQPRKQVFINKEGKRGRKGRREKGRRERRSRAGVGGAQRGTQRECFHSLQLHDFLHHLTEISPIMISEDSKNSRIPAPLPEGIARKGPLTIQVKSSFKEN